MMNIQKEFDIKVAAHFVRAVCTNILHGPESDEVKERWTRLHNFVLWSGKDCSAHLDWHGHELDSVDDLVELIEDTYREAVIHVEVLDFMQQFFDQIDAWEANAYLTIADEHILNFEDKWLTRLGLMLLNLDYPINHQQGKNQ